MRTAASVVIVLAFVVASGPPSWAGQLYGPTQYKSFDDSPFDGMYFEEFHLEDFEDALFDAPGVTPSGGFIATARFPGEPQIIDSVDGDDGNPTDGTCVGCESFWNFPASIRLTFDPSAPEGLPTHAGVVWTDGEGSTRFEAFDENGQSLGVVGPVFLADGNSLGGTGEDRFFGVTYEGGVSSMLISNTVGGIEIDHLQYGWLVECSDADGDGYGSPGGNPNCEAGEAEDCDDANPRTSPGEVEIYDGVDNNCNTAADEGLDEDGDGIPDFRDSCNVSSMGAGVAPDGCAICFADLDGDGFGVNEDCNDGDSSVNPGALEVCNRLDDDCDGLSDEGFDVDGDGFTGCSGDCNDSNVAISPGAVDLPGNTVDENCDGSLGPCDPGATWASHGDYVACVATQCEALVAIGALTEEVCDALMNQIARSRPR